MTLYPMKNEAAFKKRLECLLEDCIVEDEGDTPSWILAEHLTACLKAYVQTVGLRDRVAATEQASKDSDG